MSNANKPMDGKICLVTGATSGIGSATALMLAQQGAHLIVAGRSPEKCTATIRQIKQRTGNPDVEFLVADLSAQKEVRRLAQEFKQRYSQLHVLVNNAGALFMRRELSEDGIEMTFALNHLGYFLLTNLLLDTLKASAPARVVNVSSDAHTGTGMDFTNLQFSGWRAYQQSKLANILFTYELARRLEGSGVTVNALHPGVVASNFGANNGAMSRALRRVADLFSISNEEGAKTSIYLASSPEVDGISGQYFVKKRAVRSSKASYDAAAATKLWQISEEMTGLSG